MVSAGWSLCSWRCLEDWWYQLAGHCAHGDVRRTGGISTQLGGLVCTLSFGDSILVRRAGGLECCLVIHHPLGGGQLGLKVDWLQAALGDGSLGLVCWA